MLVLPGSAALSDARFQLLAESVTALETTVAAVNTNLKVMWKGVCRVRFTFFCWLRVRRRSDVASFHLSFRHHCASFAFLFFFFFSPS